MSSPAALALACAITVFPAFGTHVPSGTLHGPGLLLSGAGGSDTPPAAFAWTRRTLGGNGAAPHGNLVVLRASGGSLYDKPLLREGNFASVQTVFIPPCAPPSQVDRAAHVVDGADAVFFAGGDQAHYAAWKGSALIESVKRVYARGGVVGGGSAGLAIQGAVVYDSVAADRFDADTHTADAVASPLEKRISFTTGFFAWPALSDTMTDTHFVVRDRFGRLVVFLARMLAGHSTNAKVVYGLGVDEGSAVVVDTAGMATLLNGPDGRGAYLVRASRAPDLKPGQPIRYTVEVSHVAHNGERFNLLAKTTHDPWYAVTVDGSRTPAYSRDPYRP